MSHAHHHATGPTGAGSVVLELGADIGVLVLHAPAELHGREIEISKSNPADFHATHALIRARHTSSGVGYAAVYPGVPAGEYTVWRDADTPVGTVTIKGGEVARFTWPFLSGEYKPIPRPRYPPEPTLPLAQAGSAFPGDMRAV